MARSVPAPVEPAPPQAAADLSAALTATEFTISSLFTIPGNRMADADTLAAAAMMTRPRPRGRCAAS